jgi:predicted RNA binding protein YcfA (HicA-like mRNA interferase family)
MPKLLQISGALLVKVLLSLGYVVIRQRGSHVRLKKDTTLGVHSVTVPEHKVIARGTLNDIISKVGLWNNISKDEFIKKLK